MYFTFPDFPVNAVSKMLEKTGPGQRSVTAIFLSNISTPRVENQPYKVVIFLTNIFTPREEKRPT